jgi:hypothetical protein
MVQAILSSTRAPTNRNIKQLKTNHNVNDALSSQGIKAQCELDTQADTLVVLASIADQYTLQVNNATYRSFMTILLLCKMYLSPASQQLGAIQPPGVDTS